MNRQLLKMLAGARKVPGKIANTSVGRGYGEAVTPAAESVQEALMQLTGRNASQAPSVREGSMQDVVSRMAASPQVLNALKATPAIAGIYGTTVGADMIDQVFNPEDESMAGTPMDLLGMGLTGAGAAYGINRGIGGTGGTTRAGAALGIAAAAGLGKMGSDALQGLVGI